MVLLHSGVTDRRMWDPVVPHLTHRFKIIRPDFRGYGETGLPYEPYTDADDVAALLDHLDVADAGVVGSSLGGRIALELAMLHPERVRELVLLCPAYRGVPATAAAEAFDEQEERLIDDGNIEGAVRLNVDTWLGPEASEATRTQLAEMQRHALTVHMAADKAGRYPEKAVIDVRPGDVRVSTVVVSGAHDVDFFQTVARTLAADIPGADLVELAWAGHLPSLERPDAMVALLLDVLRNDPFVHAP